MSKHTFLLSEGYWKASGTFRDEQNNEYPINGETLIKHLDVKWVNKGVMRVFAKRSINITSEYEIEPLLPGNKETRWVSENPSLGTLLGTFTVSGDELVSKSEAKRS